MRLSHGAKPSNNAWRPGELFKGLYYPGVLFGRTDAFNEDIEFIVHLFKSRYASVLTSNVLDDSFSSLQIMSNTFRELSFSNIHAIAEFEDDMDTFYIMCAILTDHLKSEAASLEYAPESVHPLTSSSPPLLKDELLCHRVAYVYLMYLVYGTQYVSGPINKNEFKPRPIYIDLDTLRILKQVNSDCRSSNLFHEARMIIRKMIESDCFTYVVKEGPQYAYQDRYGDPLIIAWDKADLSHFTQAVKTCVEKARLDVELIGGLVEDAARCDAMLQDDELTPYLSESCANIYAMVNDTVSMLDPLSPSIDDSNHYTMLDGMRRSPCDLSDFTPSLPLNDEDQDISYDTSPMEPKSQNALKSSVNNQDNGHNVLDAFNDLTNRIGSAMAGRDSDKSISDNQTLIPHNDDNLPSLLPSDNNNNCLSILRDIHHCRDIPHPSTPPSNDRPSTASQLRSTDIRSDDVRHIYDGQTDEIVGDVVGTSVSGGPNIGTAVIGTAIIGTSVNPSSLERSSKRARRCSTVTPKAIPKKRVRDSQKSSATECSVLTSPMTESTHRLSASHTDDNVTTENVN